MYDTSIVRENLDQIRISASFADLSQTATQTIYKTTLISGPMMAREGMTMCMPSCMSC